MSEDDSDPVAELEAAAEELERRQERVDEVGEGDLRRLAEAHGELTTLLDRNEETATGTGEFAEFIEFQGEVGTLVEGLPEDLPHRDAFEAVSETLHRRQLRGKHFREARATLEPVADLVSRLERRDDARERYREARTAVVARRNSARSTVEDLERVCQFSEVDLDASVEPLRDPVAAYDEAVREEFRSLRRSAPAREVFDLLETAAAFPLVPFRPPPEPLREHVDAHPVGEEPLPTLREYVDYSPSKLDHYVEEPRRFRAQVGGNATYLERLDADPLAVGWPPPPADRLRHRARELIAVVGRFADEETVARLREVRDFARDPAYARLRATARTRHVLDEAERERLRSGAAAADLADAREREERLAAALERFPER
ncbi:MAG: hypothetical protein ABEJ04_05405 [Halobacteriaceae archaeon]